MSSNMVSAYLSLGSNMGDRKSHLEAALKAVSELPGVTLGKVSDLFSSTPVDMEGGEEFLNCAAEVETSLEPLELLDALEEVEHLFGRRDKGTNRPRTIDIDIIYYGGVVVSFPRLQVPHPKMAGRRFVLEPLCQLAPELVHPMLKKTAAELCATVVDQKVQRENLAAGRA